MPEMAIGSHDQVSQHQPDEGICQQDPGLAIAGSRADDAHVSKREGEGLLPFFEELDVGEQIVGSHQTFEFDAPQLADANHAPSYAAVTAHDGAPFTASWPEYVHWAPPSAAEATAAFKNRIAIHFTPTAAGEFRSTLTFTVMWPDKRVETVSTSLVGRARTLESAPHDFKELPAIAPDLKIADEPFANTTDGAFDGATQSAKDNANDVFDAQTAAVASVLSETSMYKAPPQPPSIWKALVEMAITAATAGIASSFATVFAGAIEHVVKANATLHALDQSAHLIQATAAAVEDGLKKGVEIALANPEEAVESINSVVNFFNQQQAVLRALKRVRRAQIEENSRSLRPLLGVNPSAAAAAMLAIKDGYRSAATTAGELQNEASTAAFVAFRARASLKSETVPGTHTQVSKMEDVRQLHGAADEHHALAKAPNGLIDMHVADQGWGNGEGPYVITAARVNGVPHAQAVRLSKLHLLSLGIPLRLVVNNGRVITRDEAGRIRVAGVGPEKLQATPLAHEDPVGEFSEVEAERGARELVQQLLSRTLAEQGILITSDDQAPVDGMSDE